LKDISFFLITFFNFWFALLRLLYFEKYFSILFIIEIAIEIVIEIVIEIAIEIAIEIVIEIFIAIAILKIFISPQLPIFFSCFNKVNTVLMIENYFLVKQFGFFGLL